MTLGLVFFTQQATNMSHALYLHDEFSITAMSHTMEDYQQLVALRNIVAQLHQMVMIPTI
jgi:hypothetical protein